MKKKVLLAIAASAFVALSSAVAAEARDGDNNAASFAVGSASSDVLVAGEHFAFSAHNGADATLTTPAECAAKGYLNYTTDTGIDLSADVIGLTIIPGASGGGYSFIIGQVTRAAGLPGIGPGGYVWFDVTDSNLKPDGTGDTFLFEGYDQFAQPICYNGVEGAPITSGNIVIKAGSLVP